MLNFPDLNRLAINSLKRIVGPFQPRQVEI
jgi:hypothetical protein